MKKWLIIYVCFAGRLAAQHNMDYIQYMFNGFILNPAYCGSQGAMELTALYRSQWIGIEGAPVSKSFSAHSPLKNKRINLGLSFESENFAIYEQNKLNAAYAYRVNFLNGRLSFGLQAGAQINATNWDKLEVNDQDDPSFVSTSVRSNAFTGGAGLYLDQEKFYLGLAAPKLYQSNQGDIGTYILHGGFLRKFGKDVTLKPSFLMKKVLSSPVYLNLTVTTYFKEIAGLGLGLTLNNSWMLFADLRLNEQLHFGYGYERPLNNLKNYSSGSHEVMLRYLFKYKLKVQNARYF